jgi:uncharacterized repeat protein (TIGR03803 family)
LLLIAFTLPVVTPAAQAQFQVIHTFTDGADGAFPIAGLTIQGGSLYGTAMDGGTHGMGTVYRLQHRGTSWTFSPLYSFTGGDGRNPRARVVFGPDGAIYGTTLRGGTGSHGTVFKLRPGPSVPPALLTPWDETVLYSFTGGADGAAPQFGDVNFDHAGNMYGTTARGGVYDGGVVWELTPPGIWGTETVLHTFTNSADGGSPFNGVIFDDAGNLYGTTLSGGQFPYYGTAFQLMPVGPLWMERVLYSFQDGSDGAYPTAGLLFDQAGNLYGATPTGSGSTSGGAVLELSPPGAWMTLTVLYSFTASGSGFCPAPNFPGPVATLVMDGAGSLYGTTCAEGAHGYGNVFKLTFSNGVWSYHDIYDFTGGSDGAYPTGSVLIDTGGNLYGTALEGGLVGAGSCDGSGCGVVWEITR